jgi:hypothetical protein
MKRGVLVSIGLLVIILYINGCGINHRATDPGLENDAGAQFHAHDHQRGEGFGFWNQQRDRKNPIANMVTRDERPGRGMNGIVDRRPNEMNRRISRFEDTGKARENIPKSRGFATRDDGNITEQLKLHLLSIDTVRDARIINSGNQLLIAVDSEANDNRNLEREITQYVKNQFPNKQSIVITDRRTVDRLRLLDDGFLSGRRSEDYEIQLREFFNEANEEIQGNFR